MPDAIQITHFRKEYALPRQKEKRVAVQDLTLSVPPGVCFGFLGPNGAGKTTTIKMLLGFVPPTAGGAWLFGTPVADDDARRRVGYLPEQPYFHKFLTAQEVVRAHAGFAGVPGRSVSHRVDEVLETVGMAAHRFLPLSKCSKGMTQRVGLASALVGNPDLLILDEPSSGLDPVGRKELRALLTRLKGEGKTIFLSSHLLNEMETVCDRVGVLAGGVLVAHGTPAEIVRARDSVTVRASVPALTDEQFARDAALLGGAWDSTHGRAVVPPDAVFRLLGALNARGGALLSVEPGRETLEEAFLRLVGPCETPAAFVEESYAIAA